MRQIEKLLSQRYVLLTCLVVIFMSLVILSSFADQIPAADEMVFIRLTDNLPKYESHAEWWTLDGKTHPNDWLHQNPPSDYYDNYDQPVWWHPPIANIVAYPFVKALYNEGSLDDIRQGVKNLRVVAWLMITATIILFVYLIQRKRGDSIYLLLSIIPITLVLPFYSVWGNNWFYHETFMLLFLAVALVMRETKYKKYMYIPLVLMVGSKITGVLLLIPFILENRKMGLCALILVPYFIQCHIGTGDFFYPFTHAVASGGGANTSVPFLIQRINVIRGNFLVLSRAIPLLIVAVALILYSVYLLYDKKLGYFYPSLLYVSFLVGMAWGIGYYQLVIISYAAALLVSGIIPKRGYDLSRIRRFLYARLSFG